LANIIAGSTDRLDNFVDLNTVFRDREDETDLTYDIVELGDEDIVVASLSENGIVSLSLVPGATGRSAVVFRARDSGGYSVWTTLTVNVRDPKGNLALFVPATASGKEGDEYSVENVNDGDLQTRWSSPYQDQQSVTFDLGDEVDINRVKIFWEAAYAKVFDILVSSDKIDWMVIHSENQGDGGVDVIELETINVRFIRLDAKTRATIYGFSIWEFEIFMEIKTANNPLLESGVKIYPNPVQNILHVMVPQSYHSAVITVFDPLGRTMIRRNLSIGENEVDFSEFSTGLFLAKISNGSDSSYFRISH
jgi:hypothetical protein